MARDDVVIRISGDASKLDRTLASSDARLSKFGKSVGRTAGRAGKAVAIGLGGAVAGIAAAAGATLKVGFGEIKEAEANAARTANVLKTTGGVAHVTEKQVAGLAQSIENLTGVDGDNVQAGENLLLTFTNIRNEAGKGNDIFNQTTEIMTDMSSALGQDMKSSAIQLGKALNDPIKGVTALQRVGVSFTKQQKEQIKTLVESGDTLGAQKLILKELQTEFGGAATAAGSTLQGRIEKLKRKFEALAAGLAERLVPWIEKTITFLERLGTKVEPVFTRLSDGIQVIVGRFRAGGEGADGMGSKFDQLLATTQRAWPGVQSTITDAATTVQQVLSGVATAITVLWNNFGNNILSFVRRVWPAIRQEIQGVLEVIRGIVQVITSLIRGDWSGAWTGIQQILHGALNAILGQIKKTFEIARFVVGVAVEIIGSAIKGAWRAAWTETKIQFGNIVRFITGIPGMLSKLPGALLSFGVKIGQALVAGIRAGFGVAGDILSGLKDAFDRVILGPVRAGVHTLANALASVNIPGAGRAFDAASSLLNRTADAIHLADGGIVRSRRGGVFANIAEAGRDEAVIPLPRRGESGAGMLGGVHIDQVVLGPGVQPVDLARELRWLQITRGVGRVR